GEKNHEAASEAGVQSLLLAISISIVISLVGLFFASDILQLMGATKGIIEEGASYTRIALTANIVIMLLFLI
ncbi:MATE family efflux transporter, partial [Enterobacter cloacae]|uniref:MATE family efflux transporter n=1 Tax=Enterobacter cloacae TaxID=550 RepID=UPI001952F4F4